MALHAEQVTSLIVLMTPINAWKSAEGTPNIKRSSGNKPPVDYNHYESYGSENLSKCDSGPAVWRFPDVTKEPFISTRETATECERGERGGMGDGTGMGRTGGGGVNPLVRLPQLLQLGFTSCSWYS